MIIAIHPEPGHPIVALALHEVESHNADGFGIYWHVNATRPGLTTKATKADITAIRYAHVDIDPPKVGTWDRAAVLADLLSQRPSKVIDSGNGLQGLWALQPGATVEQVETVNRGLIQRFNADKGTWNVDRVFRLPDTINWPNAIKRAAGREPVMASVLLDEPGLTYEVGALLAAWPYVAPVARAGADEIEPIAFEVIPLPERASMGTVELVMHPAGADRSVDVSRAVTAMARDGLSDAEIMGVILNPALPISGHCLDQKDPERAARRKCSLAAAHRFDPERMFPDEVVTPAGVLTEPPVRTKAKLGGYGSRNIPTTNGILPVEDQMDHFAGCVYIKKHKLVMMPDGSESDHSQFDDEMGGYKFVFTDDGKTTKSAWEAFMRNERYAAPRVHDTCFRPELEPMAIVAEEGWSLINAYVPIQTECKPGDPSPWLDHLTRMYPVEDDRKILLSWMASCLRNPGKKFQWWPVLIGAKGNAKTMILNIMEYCIGARYTHLPNAGKMTRNGINFNGWIRNKLFLGVEEVYSANRRDFLEEFKPYVTNRRLPIEGKGIEEYTGDNRANGMLTSNHWDGVPIDANERRYGIFFTAQQTAEDCFRDGLTSAYFSKLWNWLDKGGFAIVNHYLRNFPLEPAYDPAQLSTRAPRTSSTDQAIAASLGTIEQEILQAIDEERMGFKGGWISSKALDTLFKERNIRLAPNKRIGPIRAIGYDLHPGLPEGKTAKSVPPDGVRCRLYCLMDGPGWGATDPTERYMEAQLGA